ncbi:helix-turn-helix domain-containing protein [Actinocorallia populi]|uniref:helix-turn-helix domain-containing protein n=1 Tax=Actinocorallia populi TaxID=2079200 RepID=UPI000D08917D|nr:helix-turn-helix domain-containing protein [Actinocorallia populi]
MERFLGLLGEDGPDPEVVETAVRAARARSPLVAALPEDEVRRHVRALVEAALAALAAGDPGLTDLRAAEALGAARARQGVPVAALLDGFQAGRSLLVRTVVDRGRARGIPADELLEAVTRIDAIATGLEHRMVHAHRIAELELAGTARDIQVQRLRGLLHGELAEGGPRRVVVTGVSDPAAARRLEPVLAGPSGLAGMVDGRLAALVAAPPAVPGLSGVVSPLVPPERIPAMYRLCARALRPDEPALRPLAELALPTALAAEPELGELLAGELLAGLDPADPFHRALAGTALAYLDHACRIDPAAAALHVHPNTVKYRLRRLQQLTGRSLDRLPVPQAAHCWWALRTFLSR